MENMDDELRQAAHDGNVHVVQLLLDRGANIHADNDGALRRAAHSECADVVRLLVNRGAVAHEKWSAKISDNMRNIIKTTQGSRRVKPARASIAVPCDLG